MINREGFKGNSFINLDMGRETWARFKVKEPEGKVVVVGLADIELESKIKSWEEWDKYTYDPDFNFVEDDTIIDGNFEDPQYFEHYLPEIKQWLNTEPVNIPDDVCVIGFRGGEYYTVPELGLPKEYYNRAIDKMRTMGIKKFEVHTDDMEMAQSFFPNFKVFRDVELNWCAVRDAKYAIIANSSFYVLPRLLNGGLTIAPRYWNRYNTKKWDYPQNYYKQFTYI